MGGRDDFARDAVGVGFGIEVNIIGASSQHQEDDEEEGKTSDLDSQRKLRTAVMAAVTRENLAGCTLQK